MQRPLILSILLLSALICLSFSESIKKTRVLVLLDNIVLNTTHSLFFEDLRGIFWVFILQKLISFLQPAGTLSISRWYLLSILSWRNTASFYMITLCFFAHLSRVYIIISNLIQISWNFPDPKLKAGTFLEFFDAGHNLLIAGDIDTTKPFRQIFNNLGVELDEIVTHFLKFSLKTNGTF